MLTDLEKFNKFIADRDAFSFSTFGPPEKRSCRYPLLHLKDEIEELLENPNDPMEWADTDCLLIICWSSRSKNSKSTRNALG